MAKTNEVWDLDNSGTGPLRVPGFGGIPVDYQLPVDSRFAHGAKEWRQSPMVTAQETAMVAVMDRLTDKPRWFVDVFDDAIVAQWRAELDRDHFIANPRLMQGKTWAWCVQELRDKAVYYKEHHHIRVLDTGSCACKADSAELQSLSAVFRRAAVPLAQQYTANQERQERQERQEDLEKSLTNWFKQDADAGLVTWPWGRGRAHINDQEPSGDRPTVNDDALVMEESEQRVEDEEIEQANHMTTGVQNTSNSPRPVEGEHQIEGQDTTGNHPNVVEDDSDDDLNERWSMFDDDLIEYSDMEEEREERVTNIYWDWRRDAHEGKGLDFVGSAHMISNLVDPLLFPLVYGKTLVLEHGGTVALENLLASYGVAQVAPRQAPERSLQFEHVHIVGEDLAEIGPWSRRYQSLPCEVAFVNDGGDDRSNTEVKITSYINGLHPEYAEMYQAIEKVLSHTIQPWNDCLVHGNHGLHDPDNLGQLGPVPARIITYGVEWENELPDWTTAFRGPTEDCKQSFYEEQKKLQRLPVNSRKRKREEGSLLSRFSHVIGKEDWKLPPRDSYLWQQAREYLEQPEPERQPDPKGAAYVEPYAIPDDWDVGDERTWDLLCGKVRRLLRHKHPEPGTAFSNEEWKSDRHDSRPIVDKAVPEPSRKAGRSAPVTPPHMRYSVSLQDRFRDQGLQVLVEISSIELTPEMPAYAPDAAAQAAAYAARATEQFAKAMLRNIPVNLDRKADSDGWHLSGQLNEHIAAVAIFAFEVENITEPRLAFRQRLSLDYRLHQFDVCFKEPENSSVYYESEIDGPAHLIGKECDAEALAEILGAPELQHSPDNGVYEYHHIGSVATPQGRLVAFPNVLEHRINPFRLVDPAKPGRYRWLTLYLVDPHYRVCSTRNVPPQQHNWWAGAISHKLATAAGLSQEIIDQIIQDTDSWPMGMDEAQWHREQLVKERRLYQEYSMNDVGWYCS